MAGKQSDALLRCLYGIEKTIESHLPEPSKHLFIIKQHLNNYLGTPLKESHIFYRSNSMIDRSDQRTLASTCVEHAFTEDLQACVRFNVLIEQVPPVMPHSHLKRQILVCQNQITLAIEIHYSKHADAVVHELVQINKIGLHHKRQIEFMLSGPFKQNIEFESQYKLAQFLQLVKMFKMRDMYEKQKQITGQQEGTKPIENQLYLIPPIIESKFLGISESPSDNQDGVLQEFK